MVCPKCGVQMQEGSNMCIRCGTITYSNGMVLDKNKDNFNRNIYAEQNSNIEKQTFISNDIYQDIHDDKSSKFRKVLNIYLSFFLAFWCVVAIIKSIRLNMPIVDVLMSLFTVLLLLYIY